MRMTWLVFTGHCVGAEVLRGETEGGGWDGDIVVVLHYYCISMA